MFQRLLNLEWNTYLKKVRKNNLVQNLLALGGAPKVATGTTGGNVVDDQSEEAGAIAEPRT